MISGLPSLVPSQLTDSQPLSESNNYHAIYDDEQSGTPLFAAQMNEQSECGQWHPMITTQPNHRSIDPNTAFTGDTEILPKATQDGAIAQMGAENSYLPQNAFNEAWFLDALNTTDVVFDGLYENDLTWEGNLDLLAMHEGELF